MKKEDWKIDKHINLTTIIVLFVQFIGFVWWVSTIDNNIKNNSLRLEKIEIWKSKRDADNLDLLERVTRTEEKIEYMIRQNQRIETKLDKALSK